jgi:hypothetical protein
MIGVHGAVADGAANGHEVGFDLVLVPAEDAVEGGESEGLEAAEPVEFADLFSPSYNKSVHLPFAFPYGEKGRHAGLTSPIYL